MKREEREVYMSLKVSDIDKERTKRNEEIVSELEEKLGVGISEDMINKFVEFQKQNFENTNLGDADYEKMVSSNSN